jgi:acyl dehydratase
MTQHVFTSDDQLAFAKLSGDYNPLHTDPVLARRLLFGRQIVHGLHALLWGADHFFKTRDNLWSWGPSRPIFRRA